MVDTDGATLRVDLLSEPVALLQLSANAPVPDWTAAARHFLSITRTPAELSIVIDAAVVPEGVVAERKYRMFRVQGPLPLHLVGILVRLAIPLAEAGVPIFPIATYATDYVLVKHADVPRAREALLAAGHDVVTPGHTPAAEPT